LSGAGGWERVVAAAPADPAYWNVWQSGASGLAFIALLTPAFIISPGQLQKVYAARDDRTVRLGVGLNAAVLLAFAAVPVVLGIVARARHPGLANPEMALPTLLMNDVPVLLGVIGLAAVFSTEVNTADAVLFMLSTSLSQDLYRRFANPGATDAQVLRVARGAAIAGGAAGVALAIAAPSVIGVLSLFYTLLSVCLFVPVLEGLYRRRARPGEMLAAIASGIGVTVAVHLGSGGRGVGPFPPVLIGIACVATVVVAAALRPRRPSPRT
jgi:SSS family solute:Na+ symporter